MAVQFVKKGDACDMIEDLDGLFRRAVDKRCYILNGIEICDTDSSHTGDFGLPGIDKGCNIAKAASAIAGVSWYIPFALHWRFKWGGQMLMIGCCG
jgi:hypothetical protein